LRNFAVFSDCNEINSWRAKQFEKIVVVSSGPSWRTEGLIDAARLTRLDLEIPQQPAWTKSEVESFRGARCWIGHLHALKYIVEERLMTALVLEDDADWDIEIKKRLSLVAPHIRAITNSTSRGQLQPYGSTWDLL
jgi:hypothetical protein